MYRKNFLKFWTTAAILMVALLCVPSCSKDEEKAQTPGGPDGPDDPEGKLTITMPTSLTYDLDNQGNEMASFSVTVTSENEDLTEVKVYVLLEGGGKYNEEIIRDFSPATSWTKTYTIADFPDVEKMKTAKEFKVEAATRGATASKSAPISVTGGGQPPLTPLKVEMFGTINLTDWTPDEYGYVEFNRFPASVEEFKTVREQIGKQPQGAVALEVMAYEMYRRNKAIGLECIKLNNTLVNVNTPVSRLDQLFGNDAGYARPYQMAAYLKGAQWDNGYKPDKPYTVECYVSRGYEYQYSNTYQATIIFLEILTRGKPGEGKPEIYGGCGSDIVYVVKTGKPGEPSNNTYYTIDNNPGMYSQVREISFNTPFEGLD